MQESRRRIEKWVRCPYCTHRMFRVLDNGSIRIEIKCPSCKRIFELNLNLDKDAEKSYN